MTDLEALVARVQRLEDAETARGMFHRYAEALDNPDAPTVAALFADTAALRTPMGDFEGREAIEGFFARAFDADKSVKRHFIVNPRIVANVDGRVRVQSYFLYTGRGQNVSIIGWGRYDDTIDVTGPEPLFAEKTIKVHVGTDLAAGWAQEQG